MPRHSYKKVPVLPDPVYNSFEVAKLINYIMYDGKRSVAESIVYDVFKTMESQGHEPMKVFQKAILNVAPHVEVKPRRLGGASYLVPTDVRKERKLYLALHWIIDAARSRSNKEFHSFNEKLYVELLESAKGEGQAMAKKHQVEKLAEANKAFSHLKW